MLFIRRGAAASRRTAKPAPPAAATPTAGQGHGADLVQRIPSTGGAYGDAIADAVFLPTDGPPAAVRPKAREGGLYVIERRGLHTQITWKPTRVTTTSTTSISA
jgi:hypothetical protein